MMDEYNFSDNVAELLSGIARNMHVYGHTSHTDLDNGIGSVGLMSVLIGTDVQVAFGANWGEAVDELVKLNLIVDIEHNIVDFDYDGYHHSEIIFFCDDRLSEMVKFHTEFSKL